MLTRGLKLTQRVGSVYQTALHAESLWRGRLCPRRIAGTEARSTQNPRSCALGEAC